MKPYAAYKPSGVDWLGDVPSHWQVKKLKFLASVAPSNIDKLSMEGERAVKLCNYVDVYKNDKITSAIEFMPATASKEQITKFSLKIGDVVVTKDSESPWDIAVPTVIAEEIDGLVCGYHLAKITPLGTAGEYLAWAFRTPQINTQFALSSNGITRYGLGVSGLSDGVFPVPPLAEQQAIAAYLDHETARVDALLHEKQGLITLLREYRQSTISTAVTQGLNPAAPRKPSGIAWLGDVPSHWEVKRIAHVASCNDDVLPEDTSEGFLLDYVEISDVDQIEGIKNTTTMTYKEAPSRARRRVQDGDILISTVRTYLRAIAVVSDPSPNMVVSTGFAVIRPKKILQQFARYALEQEGFIQQVIARSNGVSYPAINSSVLVKIEIAVPPLAEQQAIAAHLDRETARIDALITHAQVEIALLKELRAATIADAVLGRVDVRTA